MRIATIAGAVLVAWSVTAHCRAQGPEGGLFPEPEDFAARATGVTAAPPQNVLPDAALPGPADDLALGIPIGKPRLVATADALALWRTETKGPRLISGQPGGIRFLNAADLDLGTGVSPRFGLVLNVEPDYEFELNYFGVFGWKDTANFPMPSLAGPVQYYTMNVDSLGGPNVTDASVDYRTRLHSAEFNYRRRVYPWLSPLFGFRWVNLSEQYHAVGTEYPLPLVVNHRIDTNNHFYGCQLGADLDVPLGARFGCNAFFKAGLFYNAASQTSSLNDGLGGNYGVVSAAADRDEAAFFGEIGVSAVYRILPHLAVRGGYQVMWLDGLALAPRQLSATDLLNTRTARVDTGGKFLAHGANIGLELAW